MGPHAEKNQDIEVENDSSSPVPGPRKNIAQRSGPGSRWLLYGGSVLVLVGAVFIATFVFELNPCPPLCLELTRVPAQQPVPASLMCGAACDPDLNSNCPAGLECVSGTCQSDEICPQPEPGSCGDACDLAVGAGCEAGLDCISGFCHDDNLCGEFGGCGEACDPAIGAFCQSGFSCVSGTCQNNYGCAQPQPSQCGDACDLSIGAGCAAGLTCVSGTCTSVELCPVSVIPIPLPVCGDGVCQPNEICAIDCECFDDGVCSAAEAAIGSCRDCSTEAADQCGVPCSGVCGGGLACAGGVCWDNAVCGSGDTGGGGNNGGGDDDGPQVCECVCVEVNGFPQCRDSCTDMRCLAP